MFAVTSGYFISEKVLFVRKRRLLAERETGATDNWLNTDCLLTCERLTPLSGFSHISLSHPLLYPSSRILVVRVFVGDQEK